jgi:hypothetical protein
MGVHALSPTAIELPVDGAWTLSVAVTDSAGSPVNVEPAVTVTLPNDTTTSPTVERVTTGVYRAEHVVTATGRHVARVTTVANGAVDFTAYAVEVTAAVDMPNLDDLRGDPDDDEDLGYLGRTSATDTQIQDALDAEAANQRKICVVPAAYGPDLRQALMRRVARNLAMQRIPLAVLQGDADTGSTIPPGSDPEVRRFERPYRRLPVG